MRGVVLRVALVLALLAAPAAARSVEVYRPEHRVAEEMLGIARTAMAGAGSVELDRGSNALVLVGEPGAVAEALALLAAQDRRPRTIVLRYDTTRAGELLARGFDVRWSAAAGDFRIGNVRRRGSSLDARASEDVASLAASFSGTLRVTEGAHATIETGTSVPYASAAPGGGSRLELATAATGFDARARVLGDGRIEVDLAPFAGRLEPGGRIATAGASTRVALAPGETVAIGSLGGSRDASRADVGRARSTSARDATLLLLRADLE